MTPPKVNQAVILAGGLGTRLMPLTARTPKPMVSVAGRPYLEWQLRYLQEQKISRVLLLISHMGEVIEAHFRKHPLPGVALEFAFETTPMGTGGALHNSHARLDNEFWLINGDSFLPLDFGAMGAAHAAGGWRASLAMLTAPELVPVPANLRADTKGRVTEFRKNAGVAAGFTGVDAGVYLLDKSIVTARPEKTFGVEDFWPGLIATGGLGAFPVKDRFFDIGTIDRLKTFEEHVHDYF